MRELKLVMSVTLDGFVSGPNDEIQWVFNGDQAAIGWKIETLGGAGLHLMGSHTFQAMAGFWPTATIPFTPAMNRVPKAIASRQDPATLKAGALQALRDAEGKGTLQPGGESWADAEVLGGELAGEIARLKAQDGAPIFAHGGATFARSLIADHLVDEYILGVYPIVLGHGKAIFSELPAPRPLTLVSSTTFPSGFQAQVFRPG